MTTPSWNELKTALRRTPSPTAAMPAADVFWDEFRARARLCNQEPPAAAERGARAMWPRWVVAASGVVAVTVLILVTFATNQAQAFHNPIKSYEVLAPHSAVIIMTDDQRSGTILWVAAPESAGTRTEGIL